MNVRGMEVTTFGAILVVMILQLGTFFVLFGVTLLLGVSIAWWQVLILTTVSRIMYRLGQEVSD